MPFCLSACRSELCRVLILRGGTTLSRRCNTTLGHRGATGEQCAHATLDEDNGTNVSEVTVAEAGTVVVEQMRRVSHRGARQDRSGLTEAAQRMASVIARQRGMRR